MDRAEYAKMNEVEGRMWWFRGIHANLLALVGRYRRNVAAPLLDAGCGTGGLLAKLGTLMPGTPLVGMDMDPEACDFARDKSGQPVCVGSINQLPFAAGSLGAIVSADVLCHRSVDERAALDGFYRSLGPGGVLVLNLPAYRWMMSSHDRAVHTARRYTAGRIAALLREAGFAEVRTSYWNTLLFPLMVLRRTLLDREGPRSDVMEFPAPVEAVFRLAMRVESLVIRAGLPLPFGGSVLAVGIKGGMVSHG